MSMLFTLVFSSFKNRLSKGFFLIGSCLLLVVPMQAQQLAFPGAEGAGKFTTGGRGTPATPTKVFVVNTLADNTSPGSLRYAIEASSSTYPSRIIVFRVAGTIHLGSALKISKPNTTIEGQTAPGDGICIADYPVSVSADNVIVRYIRFRMGDRFEDKGMVNGSGDDDAFDGTYRKNVIIDHCTMSWSDDEACTFYGGDSLTLQWNIISEPLNYSYHFETGDADYEHHGYGGIWGGRHASFHHNLLAHCQGRSPRFDGSRNLSPYTAGQENADFRNNVLYDWGSYNVNGGEGGNYNIVNNYYKYGPSTSTGSSAGVPVKYEVINPGQQTSSPVLPYGKYYLSGNYVDGSAAVTGNNWLGAAMNGGSPADTSQSKVTTPFDLGTIATQPAADAYELVLENAGVTYPNRDTLDQRIVNDVRNRTGHVIDVQGGYPHGTPYAETSGAWPTLDPGTPPADTDGDGIPDSWESANSLDPNDPSDAVQFNANGYTNIENYINSLTATPSLAVTGTTTAFLQDLGTPSASQSVQLTGMNLSGNVTVTAPAGFEVSADGGITWYDHATPLAIIPVSGTISVGIAIRLNAAANGTYTDTVTIAATGVGTLHVGVNGTTVEPGGSIGILQEWPFTTNGDDSAAVRSPGVAASTPGFNNLYLSNGTEVPTIPAYSDAYGEAFGATAAGDGFWSTSQGGPGGNLNRSFYQQFTITASSGYAVTVDSLLVTASFLNTSSNTKLAVVYSKTGFAGDSSDVTGGLDPSGAALPAGAYGAFAAPIALANQAPPVNRYALALAGATGVGLAAGETLTVRLYFSCSSSSAGRYAMVKDLVVKGSAAAIGATPGITVTGTLHSFSQSTGTPSATQTYTVSGNSLGGDITITPPSGYEVSADNGSTWHTNGSPLTLAESGGTVAGTGITVRLNAGADGAYAGDILHTSPGVDTLKLAVTGSATTAVSPPAGTAAIVAPDGSGDYTSVQAAIDAAPTGSSTPYIIFIRNGRYKEKVVIPSNKPFIHLIGESAANTILTWNDGASTPASGGGTVGTFNSYTLYVAGSDFLAMNLTVENTYGDGSQAVAIHVNADRAAFKNCRFLGNQDTMLTNGNTGYRQYFKNCYIDGNVDFIFGSARAIFDSCIVYAKTRSSTGSSFITAANTQAGQPYGYVFRDCVFPANRGGTVYYLGRPWQNSTGSSPVANNKVVYLNATFGRNLIQPEGWTIWDAGTNTSLIYYGEYRSKYFDSTLVNTASRVGWSYQLNGADAATYSDANLFGDWDPCSASPDFCAAFTPSIAVSNFIGTKSGGTSSFTWNISWPMAQVTYELFRSTDGLHYSVVNTQVSDNDTSVNFSYSEAAPAAGSSYYYFLKASKPGLKAHITDTIELSSIPTITVSGTLNDFLQGLGTPSATQVYAVSAVNLLGDLVITPPPGYEVSADGGSSWFTHASPLTMAPSGNAVSANISVRLNATGTGTYSGDILHLSTGADTAKIAVNGTVQSEPLPVSNTLLYWPFDVNNTDSADFRSPGVAASSPAFLNLYASDGVTVAAVPAYSDIYGQAFGASAAGEGYWGTAQGGPGGNLSRSYYEQYTVTATDGYSVRIDSILLNSSFYNTSSNTKLAVVYSLTGFAADSADVTGGIGLGSPLLSSANGAFDTPVLLGNQTSGTTNNYRLALAGSTGVTIAEGQTLTIRLYFSCGSSSPGRYGKVKDVYIKGLATLPPPVISTAGTLNVFSQTAGSPSDVQTYGLWAVHLTGDLRVTPPEGFEVSADNGTSWYNSASPLVLSETGGTIDSTTISVRLNATVKGDYAGDILHTSDGADTVLVSVHGTLAGIPAFTVNGTPQDFSQTAGTPSDAQSFGFAGSDLTGEVTMTPPAGYEISIDGTTWINSTGSLTRIPAADGSVGGTLQVRLNASAAGTYSGMVTFAGNGFSAISVPVNGIMYEAFSISPNPAGQYLVLYHPKLYTIGTITIYNLEGIKMGRYYTQSASDHSTIFISNLSPGMYFVEYRRFNVHRMLRFVKQ